MHEILTRWTVRAALLAMFLVLILRARGKGGVTMQRRIWTLGCASMAAHIALAFHFYHHWSHADAVAETARQTEAMIGRRVGAGVWLNYLFLVTWIADAGWWWIKPVAYHGRAPWISHCLVGFWVFISFHATVVFESGPTRWAGVLVLAVWAGAVMAAARERRIA